MTAVIGGRYRIIEPLGRGGQGRVFAGEDLHTGRPVAIKRYTRGVERAARELRALAAVHHPNMVALLDHGPDEDGCLVLVEERVSGVALADRLGHRLLTTAQAIEVIADIAGALGYPKTLKGVVIVEVTPDSRAARSGLQRNDVVTDVGRVAVATEDEFKAAIEQAGEREVVFRVRRGDEIKFVPLKP